MDTLFDDGAELARYRVEAQGSYSMAAARDIHIHAPVAADEGEPSLDDKEHQALLREHEQREEFKVITGGIDERRSRRKQLNRLIRDLDFDAREIGLLYKHGYLFFRDEVLDLDQSRLPVYGVSALLVAAAPFIATFAAMFFRTSADQKLLSALCLALLGIVFGGTFVVVVTSMRRWMIMRRLARKWRQSSVPQPARGFRLAGRRR